MAKMIALVPAVALRLTPDWQVVATEAGRYGKGLRVTIALAHEGDTFDEENLDLATGEARRAYALIMVRRLVHTTLDAMEKALSTLFKTIEGQLRRAQASPTTVSALDAATHPYSAQDGGLVWMKEGPDGSIPVRLTNFTARFIGDRLYDDGAEVLRQWEIEATLGGTTRTCSVAVEAFAGMTWVAGCLGTKAIVLPGMTLKDHARAAIQFLSDAVTTQTIYSHLGWREVDGQWVYLHAQGALGVDGPVADLTVECHGALQGYHLRVPRAQDGASLEQATVASANLLKTATKALTWPLYAAVWRTVLGESDFSVHLAGKTGLGKTTLASLLQQHWGAGMDATHLPGSWSSTGNALEGLAFQAKDALVVVDDFAPTGSAADQARLHREADRLLRAQGNRSGRGRMRADGSLRPPRPPRGLVLSTGEDIPQGQSLRARVLILELEAGQLNWSVVTLCQAAASQGQYAALLGAFVQWLAPHYGTVQTVRSAELRILRGLIGAQGHLRTVDIIAQLLWGVQHYLAFLHDHRLLEEDVCLAMWREAVQCCVQAGARQAEYQASEDPVARFPTLLAAVLSSGQGHLAQADSGDGPPREAALYGWVLSGHDQAGMGVWKGQGDRLGWLREEELLLDPDTTYRALQRFADGQHAPLPISQRTLWKRLREHKVLLAQESQQQNTVVRKIAGHDKRVLVLPTSSLSRNSSFSSATPETAENSCSIKEIERYCFPDWWTVSVSEAVL